VSDDLRPVPGDPGAAEVQSMLDLSGDEWWLGAEGDYSTAAVESMQADGTHFQRLIALEWPVRLNRGTERKRIRLLIAPEDALGLAEVLTHTAMWLRHAGKKP